MSPNEADNIKDEETIKKINDIENQNSTFAGSSTIKYENIM